MSMIYKKWRSSFLQILWGILVLVLPITSLPILSKTIHSNSVAPASFIPAFLLMPFWVIAFIKNRESIPLQIKYFLLFFAFASISSLLPFFRTVPPYKENSLLSAVFEGMASLIIGGSFLLLPFGFIKNESALKNTLLLVNLSGALAIIWSFSQLFFIITADSNYPFWLLHLQLKFSTTTLFSNRLTGLASEPSWYAHQLNMVFLPYWLSASLCNFTILKQKIRGKISIENILLTFGIVNLILTFSRIGLASFSLVLGFLFIRQNIRLYQKIRSMDFFVKRKFLLTIALIFSFVIIYSGVLLIGVYIFSKVDSRMASVFSFDFNSADSIMLYFKELQFGERVAYWQTGWNIFKAYPILGVGLGVAGFYFPKFMPSYGWQLREVQKYFFHSSGLLNIKCLWVRLLAETGGIGFSLFIYFLLIITSTAKKLIRNGTKLAQVVGWMGIFMLISLILEGFSIDTFALPYYWFTIGLVCATQNITNSTQH